jgi:uncharacterized damage-inducible protein DinB
MYSVIRSLYHYHVWANDWLFITAAKLSPAQWLAPSHATFGSLRDVMTHIVGCERGWICKVQGQDVPGLSAEDFGSVWARCANWGPYPAG